VTEKTRCEEFKIDGRSLMGKLEDLLHEGNVRRVTVKNRDGKALLDMPLTVGVVGAALAPAAAAIGAVLALAAEYTLAIERVEEAPEATATPPAG
jgi:hypothetical protein